MITQREVRELFCYDPDTGVVTRRVGVGKKVKAGDVVGSVLAYPDGKSYLGIQINRKSYLLHRIIWLYVHGEFPEEIDHINGNGCDNRLVNLRDVDCAENNRNRRKPSNNTSGIVGVSWNKANQKWVAQITANGERIYLGYFPSIEEAAQARQLANITYQFHVNHGADRPL